MPQLHLYVPDELAERIQREAKAANKSVSRYLSDLVTRNVSLEWPEDFFEAIVGGWQGEPLTRPPQGTFEERELIEMKG
jgi:hypothetical protein